MTIYRYGNLQELKARKEGHSVIDQVKRGLFINIDKNVGYSYIWQS